MPPRSTYGRGRDDASNVIRGKRSKPRLPSSGGLKHARDEDTGHAGDPSGLQRGPSAAASAPVAAGSKASSRQMLIGASGLGHQADRLKTRKRSRRRLLGFSPARRAQPLAVAHSETNRDIP